jgi:excisionase family DNA binding protein
VRDVAAFLRIGRNSVYRMAQSGALPSRRVGARIRFVPEEIRAWVARSRDQGAAVLPLDREGP